MFKRTYWKVGIGVLALVASGVHPLMAANLRVDSLPLSNKIYERTDLESVSAETKMPLTEWLAWVRSNNKPMARDISTEPLCNIVVQAPDAEETRNSITPFVNEARKEAALWGANQLHLTDKVVDASSGRVARVSFTAYRIQYKEFLIPPDFLIALAYTPLPETYVQAQLQNWDTAHFGRVKMSFIAEHGQVVEANVVNFLSGVKTGTPVRLVLRDGSNWRGTFSGLDVDDQVWIRPVGLGGHFLDRSFHAKDVEAVGLLN